MDPRQLEALATRLGQNANDSEALNAAYAHGQTDPRGYAVFLEKAGATSVDPAYGAHWYVEAANVWTTSLSDPHRAVRALMNAVDRDASHEGAASRLTAIYREKADLKGVFGVYDRRTKNLEKLLSTRPDLEPLVASLYAEFARFLAEEMAQPDRAIEAYRKAITHNPADAYSIYQARELLKSIGRFAESVEFFEAERRLSPQDTERAKALYIDEAGVQKEAGNFEASTEAFLRAQANDTGEDAALKQQLGTSVLERVQAGKTVSESHLSAGSRAFVSLAETYDGEYGYSYSLCALGIEPVNDRAAQLAMYYGSQLSRQTELAPSLAAYLGANPGGAVAGDAKAIIMYVLGQTGDETLLTALTPKEDAAPEVRVLGHLELARVHSQRGNHAAAEANYRLVIGLEPANGEAVDALRLALRTASKDRELRVLLETAANEDSASLDERVAWLQEVAELCDGPLGDLNGAIEARRKLVLLDPSDEDAADHLESTLAKAGRHDDLAELLARRAEVSVDTSVKLARLGQLVRLNREQRKDENAAASTLAEIARIEPDDEATALDAVVALVETKQAEKAIALLTGLLSEVLGSETRVAYGLKLAGLYEAASNWMGAGAAYAEAASSSSDKGSWRKAEHCFVKLEAWEQAATAVAEQVALSDDTSERAALLIEQAKHLEKLGDSEGVIDRLKESVELDPTRKEVFTKLDGLLSAVGRHGELVQLLLSQATSEDDGLVRASLRKRAAYLMRDQLSDLEGMRQALSEVLEDEEDVEAFEILAADAEASGEVTLTGEFLRRLEKVLTGEKKLAVTARLVDVFLGEGDEEAAMERLVLLVAADDNAFGSLRRLAELEVNAGHFESAHAHFKKLVAVLEGEERLSAARELAELSLERLSLPLDALAAYEIILALDPEDLEVVERLRDLSEGAERWTDYVRYQKHLIEVEGDENASAEMGLALAVVLDEKLSEPMEALAVLEGFAKEGHDAARDRFIELGDREGKQVHVATKLVDWLKEAPGGPKRNKGLRAAYDRFVSSEKYVPALAVGLDLLRMKGADEDFAESLESVATKLKSVEGLQAAYVIVGKSLSGPPRAAEMVRQAETLAAAGFDPTEAILHGEQALTSVAPDEAENLLQKLAALAPTPELAIEVYERQISRCKSPEERKSALVRAAEVAFSKKEIGKTKAFLELAVQSSSTGEPLAALVERVKIAELKGATGLVLLFVEVLAHGEGAARDGGRSRSELLGQAAALAHAELKDKEKAYNWLGEALIHHVDDARLGQLVALAEKDGDLVRAVTVMTHALEKVHDGPLVRQLLRKRYELRSERLNDKSGAAQDLKRLYELSPSDHEISGQLEAYYVAESDHKGLVLLFEDQILRSKDQTLRGELARRVAHLWEKELHSPREAADAWRRVLRLKAGDEEAKEGLERAKIAQRTQVTAETEKHTAVEAAPTAPAAPAADEPTPTSPVSPPESPPVSETKEREPLQASEGPADDDEADTSVTSEAPSDPERDTGAGDSDGANDPPTVPDVDPISSEPGESANELITKPVEPSFEDETTDVTAPAESEEAASEASSTKATEAEVSAEEPAEAKSELAAQAPIVSPSVPPPLPPVSSTSVVPPPLPAGSASTAPPPIPASRPSLPPPLPPASGPRLVPSIPPPLPERSRSTAPPPPGEVAASPVPPPIPAVRPSVAPPLPPPVSATNSSAPPAPTTPPGLPAPSAVKADRPPLPPPAPSGSGRAAPPPPPSGPRPPIPPPSGASKMPLPPPPPGKKPPPPPSGKK